MILTPDGNRAIETIKVGDIVTSICCHGTSAPIKVQSVFVTQNRLVRIETEDDVLITSPTQPLCLEDGQIRPTEEIHPGDRIVRWVNGKRRPVTVRRVVLTDRQEKVFNLVLGNSEVFVAGGYLARSKPPVVTAQSTPSVSVSEPAVPTNKE
jgi:hypothetical protein